MIDTTRLLPILVQAGSFIAAFAALAAAVIMFQVTKKFGTGILASGFKAISMGVFFIALGIIIDSGMVYFKFADETVITLMQVVKEAFFVIGTYIIVIGSKGTGDKLESLTK